MKRAAVKRPHPESIAEVQFPLRSMFDYGVVCLGQGREKMASASTRSAMLITARDLILRRRASSEREIRDGLAGNICRCTGYTNIVTAIAEAAKQLGGEPANA